MDNIEVYFENLIRLDHYEKIGCAYYDKHGRMLSIEQFVYLLRHDHLDDPVNQLDSPTAETEQKAIRSDMHEKYGNLGLSSQLYMPEGRTVEIEHLLRYIEIPKHKHEFVEMVCVLNGQCVHVIRDDEYVQTAGDFTIIPPSIEHKLLASPDCVCLTAKMRSDDFLNIFSSTLLENSILTPYFNRVLDIPNYRCVFSLRCGDDPFVRETMLRLYVQQEERRAFSESIIEGLWRVLLAYMLQNYQDTAQFLVSDAVQHQKMVEILNYIFANYQSITLAETARHFYVSVPYLSAKIHKLTGRTFSSLLKAYKLQRASELLVSTDKPLDFVCEQVGYHDTAQFVRSFKAAYGLTPYKYRKAAR